MMMPERRIHHHQRAGVTVAVLSLRVGADVVRL
jgi:hypothetical protein